MRERKWRGTERPYASFLHTCFSNGTTETFDRIPCSHQLQNPCQVDAALGKIHTWDIIKTKTFSKLTFILSSWPSLVLIRNLKRILSLLKAGCALFFFSVVYRLWLLRMWLVIETLLSQAAFDSTVSGNAVGRLYSLAGMWETSSDQHHPEGIGWWRLPPCKCVRVHRDSRGIFVY